MNVKILLRKYLMKFLRNNKELFVKSRSKKVFDTVVDNCPQLCILLSTSHQDSVPKSLNISISKSISLNYVNRAKK